MEEREELYEELRGLACILEDILLEYEKGKIKKEVARSKCRKALEEFGNFLVLKREDWGFKLEKAWSFLRVWQKIPLTKELQALKKRAEEMPEVAREVERIERCITGNFRRRGFLERLLNQ